MTETVDNKCEHCGKVFARASTLLSHTCESKRRWNEQNNPANRVGFNAWVAFFKSMQPTSKKVRNYREFTKSPYYGAFVKFGSYCVDTKVINPEFFAAHLLKNNIGVDYWCSDKHYTEYLLSYMKTEDAMGAVRRGIIRLADMGDEENIQLRDTFKYLNVNRLCTEITSGRISPWILYNIGDPDGLWVRFNEHHLDVMYPYIDPEVWKPKFARDKQTTDEVKFVLKEVGL